MKKLFPIICIVLTACVSRPVEAVTSTEEANEVREVCSDLFHDILIRGFQPPIPFYLSAKKTGDLTFMRELKIRLSLTAPCR